jgi:hypothetical protein
MMTNARVTGGIENMSLEELGPEVSVSKDSGAAASAQRIEIEPNGG